MPGPLVNVGSVAMCPHGGQVTIVSSDARVLASGTPVATLADQFMIAGCAFTIPPPQPCLMIRWMLGATRVLVNGTPPVLQTGVGMCIAASGPPNGPPIVVSTQPRVIAT
jgi:uncharacterized Zn-binding protein involved in type VI secretion